MQQTATITSKRQLTIPVEIFNQLGLKQGHKVIVSVQGKAIKITSASDLIEKLAGSVKVPKEFKETPIEQIIQKAKITYFKNSSLSRSDYDKAKQDSALAGSYFKSKK